MQKDGEKEMKYQKDGLLDEFTPKQIEKLDGIINQLKEEPGGLIPLLEASQALLGYLPITIQKYISLKTNTPLSRIYGIVTFYSFFTMKPRGRHTLRVCLGTACYVRGGKEITEIIEREYKVKPGETTADKNFTYETVRCLGACGLSPVVVVDDEVYGRIKPSEVIDLLKQYKK